MSGRPAKAVRHRKMLRDSHMGLTKPAIKRVCRQAGVVRIKANVYDYVRGITKIKLEQILGASIAYTEASGRKTVSVADVIKGIDAATGDHVAFDPKGPAATSRC